ncbi:MAG: hypothetical protein LBK60_00205 [Verrucomicrobiales bacterium]|jgi:predicted DNA binding CopG/RHH family protein|nr:hypothetical protein [Verrucomicrobiales bacterium]
MRKIKRDKDGYEYDSDDFRTEDVGAKTLTRAEEAALGIPSPAEFAKMFKSERVNLQLSARSVNYFKAAAKKERVPYQRLIRAAVDFYVDNGGRWQSSAA